MKNIVLISAIIFSNSALSQIWTNLTYSPDQPGIELNPLKGFSTMFQPSNSFPRGIQGRLFGLDEVMIGMNNFDWSVIDTFLSQVSSEGNHAYIQVNIDPAFGNTDMPDFLMDLVDWEYYDDGNVADSCPDWNDPDLMAAMLNFIDAFGAMYNDDERIFMVHLGLYGMWGEWHIGSVEDVRPEFVMTEANKTLLANAYKDAFPDVLLLARYPENMPDPQNFGYSDGLFFGQSISNSQSYFFHNILKTSFSNENWKLHPIGGEIDPSLQPIIFDNLPNQVGQNIFDCLDSIRPSWLFCHHLLTDAIQGTAEWDNAIQVQKAMGYSFFVDKYRLSASEGKPAIEVAILNEGIAPIYKNWEIEFGILNQSNQFQSLGFKNWNLSIIQPDMAQNYRSFLSDLALPDGTYTFLMRVVNPLETISSQAKILRFANTTQDADSIGWLTLGTQTISAGDAGMYPIPVTDMFLSPATATITVGDQLQLSGWAFPANASNQSLTYFSDQPMIASVNQNGLVSAGPTYGVATIYAYTQDAGLVRTSIINVEPVRVPIPALIEAEDFITHLGTVDENCSEGGLNLAFIDNGDWMKYGVLVNIPYDFVVDLRYASQPGGGEITIYDETNDSLTSIQIPSTGDWQSYETVTSDTITFSVGSHDLKFKAISGDFNLNWIEFRVTNPDVSATALMASNSMFYPNPTLSSVTLTSSNKFHSEQYFIQNLAGQIVFQGKVDESTNLEIDLTNYEAGIYFISIGNQRFKVVKG